MEGAGNGSLGLQQRWSARVEVLVGAGPHPWRVFEDVKTAAVCSPLDRLTESCANTPTSRSLPAQPVLLPCLGHHFPLPSRRPKQLGLAEKSPRPEAPGAPMCPQHPSPFRKGRAFSQVNRFHGCLGTQVATNTLHLKRKNTGFPTRNTPVAVIGDTWSGWTCSHRPSVRAFCRPRHTSQVASR